MDFVHRFVSLPSDLHIELSLIAQQRGIDLSDLMIECLVQHAEAHRDCLWKKPPMSTWSDLQPNLLVA